MHATFLDAYGYMRSVNSLGLGYVFTSTTEKKRFKNSMLVEQFSGIFFPVVHEFFEAWLFP